MPQWGVHFLDLAHFIAGLGIPETCVCLGGVYTWTDEHHFTAPDQVQALWSYPEGLMISYSTNFGNSAGNVTRFCADKGTLRLDWSDATFTAEGGINRDGSIRGENKVEPIEQTDHWVNWYRCMRDGGTPNAALDAGYQHAVASIMATMSVRDGAPHEVRPRQSARSPSTDAGLCGVAEPVQFTAKNSGEHSRSLQTITAVGADHLPKPIGAELEDQRHLFSHAHAPGHNRERHTRHAPGVPSLWGAAGAQGDRRKRPRPVLSESVGRDQLGRERYTCAGSGSALGPPVRTSFSTWPSRMWMTRWAWAAMSASCVTRTIVLPACVEPLEQRHDLDAGLRVEVAGRLVGEQDRRVVHERAGDRDALALTARELVRLVAHPIFELDLVAALRARAPGDPSTARRRRPAAAPRCAARMARGSRLKVWKTNPISSFRMRASSLSFISLTCLPFSR